MPTQYKKKQIAEDVPFRLSKAQLKCLLLAKMHGKLYPGQPSSSTEGKVEFSREACERLAKVIEGSAWTTNNDGTIEFPTRPALLDKKTAKKEVTTKLGKIRLVPYVYYQLSREGKQFLKKYCPKDIIEKVADIPQEQPLKTRFSMLDELLSELKMG